ncbi:hypothetical protein SEA_LEOPARD_45 [Mycobacterium phage Leopard]|nr:hypothetical protein SEA_LEOPARD_45 [Mycobacterium phage Leopard]
MGAAEDVVKQFIAETNTLYEGHPNGSVKVPDLRAMIKYLSWDLLRFQKPAAAATGDVKSFWGLRDSVTRQHLVAEQNNYMLRKLCEANGIDLSGMPGT